jgi:hypothetical protein
MAEGDAEYKKHQASDWRALISDAVRVLWPDFSNLARWIEAQVNAESAGDPRAESSAGAVGLLQLMPGTAAEMGVTNPYDPDQNLRGSIGYLKKQFVALDEIPAPLDRLLWSFAAYNCGRGFLDFNGGPINTCLELAKADEPRDWWRYDVGRYWLMHRDLVFRGLRPDYRQVWGYIKRIRAYYDWGHL